MSGRINSKSSWNLKWGIDLNSSGPKGIRDDIGLKIDSNYGDTIIRFIVYVITFLVNIKEPLTNWQI